MEGVGGVAILQHGAGCVGCSCRCSRCRRALTRTRGIQPGLPEQLDSQQAERAPARIVVSRDATILGAQLRRWRAWRIRLEQRPILAVRSCRMLIWVVFASAKS